MTKKTDTLTETTDILTGKRDTATETTDTVSKKTDTVSEEKRCTGSTVNPIKIQFEKISDKTEANPKLASRSSAAAPSDACRLQQHCQAPSQGARVRATVSVKRRARVRVKARY